MSSIYSGLLQSSDVCPVSTMVFNHQMYCPVSTVISFNHQMYVQYRRWSSSINRCMSCIYGGLVQSSHVCPVLSTVVLFNHRMYVQYLQWSSSIIRCMSSIYGGLQSTIVCPVSTVVFNHQMYVQYLRWSSII